MKYLIPIMFLVAFAMPLPAQAQKPDPSCVKGDCPKTDPAREAEKEMHQAAGTPGPIEAPVEEAASPKPVTPMQASEAIKEIEQAIAKETVEQKITSGASGASYSGQTPSCAPFAPNQQEVGAKIRKNEELHFDEQKVINEKILTGIRHHLEEQVRIGGILNNATAKHAQEQQVQMASSAAYQRQLREEGRVISDKLAAKVRQHKEEGLALRCLTTEKMMSFSLKGSFGMPAAQGQGQGQRR